MPPASLGTGTSVIMKKGRVRNALAAKQPPPLLTQTPQSHAEMDHQYPAANPPAKHYWCHSLEMCQWCCRSLRFLGPCGCFQWNMKRGCFSQRFAYSQVFWFCARAVKRCFTWISATHEGWDVVKWYDAKYSFLAFDAVFKQTANCHWPWCWFWAMGKFFFKALKMWSPIIILLWT